MTNLSAEAQNLNWLLESFVDRVSGVIDAIAVSADGLLMAMSAGIGRAGADQLAAVTSGLTSLTQGAARCFGGGEVNQVVVELEGGYMFFMSIGQGSSLAVVAGKASDVGLIGYEMSMLTKRMGGVLTPLLIAELQAALPESDAGGVSCGAAVRPPVRLDPWPGDLARRRPRARHARPPRRRHAASPGRSVRRTASDPRPRR